MVAKLTDCTSHCKLKSRIGLTPRRWLVIWKVIESVDTVCLEVSCQRNVSIFQWRAAPIKWLYNWRTQLIENRPCIPVVKDSLECMCGLSGMSLLLGYGQIILLAYVCVLQVVLRTKVSLMILEMEIVVSIWVVRADLASVSVLLLPYFFVLKGWVSLKATLSCIPVIGSENLLCYLNVSCVMF